MSSRLVPTGRDATGRADRPLRITVDGEPAEGIAGQTLAGLLLASGRSSWRQAPSGAPRGVFCGIGVCFDCLVTVNGEPDVRACRRRAVDGDEVTTRSRAGRGPADGPESGAGEGR
ncbi:(2Fe-2S)-binding protein [Streptomyces tubbatahanensis]|uniref:(2Fe-2S)-binding protein n=1 Tax=Streptomyces tubbatahanensis TaxID=2923272 RepID=A0ABY3XPU2_9ACTN|nr:(2Fe-2S)-binding protein [Streptomyces tubbatahanensis]UNS96467.1 (2Fe-2S)-binding protein [Streptomyces tubbatahanensis]